MTPDPIAGAYVWVPQSGTLPGIVPGISCETCVNPPNALAVAITGPDGSFTLPNVPVVGTPGGTVSLPIVVQVGRWARLQTFTVNVCAPTALPKYTAGKDVQLRLPRTSAEGNLPWFAFDTGSVDALECVLMKMGISSTMFATPATVISDMGPDAGAPKAGGTRVAIYTSPDLITGVDRHGNPTTTNYGGAFGPGGVETTGDNLYTAPAVMDEFDAVLFPCVGKEITGDKSATDIQNVVNYANSGGRVFGTHYSYAWTFEDYENAPTTATPSAYGWGCTTAFSGTGNAETYGVLHDGGRRNDRRVGPAAEHRQRRHRQHRYDHVRRGLTFGEWMVDLGALRRWWAAETRAWSAGRTSSSRSTTRAGT